MIVIVEKTDTITDTLAQVLRRVKARFRSRVLEWEHAFVTLGFGLMLMINPGQFNSPNFQAFLGGVELWSGIIFLAAILRIAALCINGYMARPTAVFRVFAAVTGILMFAVLALGFLMSGQAPTGMAVYAVLGFFGLFPVFWAVLDVAIPDTHNDARY